MLDLDHHHVHCKVAVAMVLVNWNWPLKLINNDLKWQKVSLLWKQLMIDEGKVIVLTYHGASELEMTKLTNNAL